MDFEKLLGQSPNPYVIMDRDLTLVWMNDAYLKVTMRSRQDLIGRKLFEAFPVDDGSESFHQLARSLKRTISSAKPDEIALIRYDIEGPDGMSVRYWSATHTPITNDAGEVEHILQHTIDVTELHNLRQLRAEMDVVRRADAVEARNRDLYEESRKMLELFEQAPGFVAVLEGEDHHFRMANDAYLELVGREDIVGKPAREAMPEIVEQGFIETLNRVRATGEPYVGRREPVALGDDTQDGSVPRFLNFIFQPIFDEHDENNVFGIMVQGYDITEEVEYEERQRLLINELNHRVKNTLAIVQGLAAQSFSKVAGAEQAKDIFSGRLQALAAAHNLLTQASWGAAPLRDIVMSSAEATAGELIDRFEFSGPDLTLPPQTSVSLAMIVHELSTNAIKYGGLSTQEGKVLINWDVREEGNNEILSLVWEETGGPPVEAPERPSFGMRLISRGLSSDSGSKAEIDFPPSGIICTIETPIVGDDL